MNPETYEEFIKELGYMPRESRLNCVRRLLLDMIDLHEQSAEEAYYTAMFDAFTAVAVRLHTK